MKQEAGYGSAGIVLSFCVSEGAEIDSWCGITSSDRTCAEDVCDTACSWNNLLLEPTVLATRNQAFTVYGAKHGDIALWNGASRISAHAVSEGKSKKTVAVPVACGVGMLGVEGFICQRLLRCILKMKADG